MSPQFHVQHDDFFETVKEINSSIKHLKWKSLAGLNTTTETSTNKELMTSFQDKFSQNRPNVEIDKDTTMVPLENDTQVVEETTNPVRRSSRVRKMTDRMRESIEQGLLARNSTVTHCDEEYFEVMHNLDYSIQQDLDSPITYLAKTDRDTMYLHQALREPDREKFVQAVIKEMNDHIVRDHWKLIPISQVPANQKVLDAVWSMKRKRHLLTGEVYKWKARLNVHGGQQEYAVNYFDTYAPVVAWPVIRILMTLSILNKWKTRQIDFVLAYPQAKNQYDIYMRLPHGIQMKHTKEQHCLKLQRNLYGGRDAGRTFYLFMVKGLCELGFSKSAIDECVFYRDDTIFFSYVDDGIIIAPNESKIKTIISDLNKKFDIEDKGNINEYLGVKIEYLRDNRVKLYQPHLIKQIVSDLNLNPRIRGSQIPAASSKILHRYRYEQSHTAKWDYRSVIGKLNFLEKSTRPDISYAVHQCARFSSDPKKSHTQAVDPNPNPKL